MKASFRPAYLLWAIALLSLYGCPPVNWYETYRIDEQHPFDLYVLYELLEARPEGLTVLQDTSDLSQLDSLAGSNYVYVGHRPFYGEAAVTGLLDYVERGNTAFLATEEIPEDLAYHLFGDDCYYSEYFEEYYYEDTRFPTIVADTVNTYRYPSGDSFQLVNIRFWKPAATSMAVVNDLLLCDETLDIQVLGSLDTFGTNFLRLGWGRGNFYFHSNPHFFTNWFLVDSAEYRYPEALLSVIADGPILWDEYHRRYRRPPAGSANNTPQAQRQYNGGRNLLNGNDTLLYIQERRELAFAWYTLLVGSLLFVIFRGRRRQRIIPIIPPRENSSRRFIDTISRLVYQKGNHTALAQRELASLRFHLNTRLGLSWAEGQPPPASLASRVSLPAKVVERAVTQIRVVAKGKELKEGDLLRFYRAIEPLYGV